MYHICNLNTLKRYKRNQNWWNPIFRTLSFGVDIIVFVEIYVVFRIIFSSVSICVFAFADLTFTLLLKKLLLGPSIFYCWPPTFAPIVFFLLQVELTLCHLASLMTLFKRCVYFDFFTSGGTQIRALSMNKPHFSSTLSILPSIEFPWAAAILKRKNVSIIFIFTFCTCSQFLKIW